jgi:hypothetical protein
MEGLPIFLNIHRFKAGFPSLPILYIFMAEALSRRLDKERLQKSIPGIKIIQGAKRMNHS